MALASDIRSLAADRYIGPAIKAGKSQFSIAVRDLMKDARARGISTVQRTPPFCTSIQTQDFLDEHGLEITRVDGPPKKLSTTVVVHYRLRGSSRSSKANESASETPEERAFRLTEQIRGLMRDEIAHHGGAESYLRWVRGEDEEAA